VSWATGDAPVAGEGHGVANLQTCNFDTSTKRMRSVGEMAGTEGWVYFAQVGEDGPIKIGWSMKPLRRVAEGQTWHWERLRVLGTSPGGVTHETELQAELSEYRMVETSREWYRPEPAVFRVIERCTVEGYDRETWNWQVLMEQGMAYPPSRYPRRRGRDGSGDGNVSTGESEGDATVGEAD